MTHRAIVFSLLAAWAACSFVASAQINIAALAQFKQNQQAALAKQLQSSAAASTQKPGKAGKHGKKKAEVAMDVSRPPLIKAQNRSFKGNFTDMRKTNVR